MKELIEAITILQNALKKYQNKQTPDGPYIMIWPDKVEVLDCYGTSMITDNDPVNAANCLDALD